MRSSPLIFVAVALAMVAVAFAGTTPEVITLTDADFHQALADVPNAVWLVELYANQSIQVELLVYLQLSNSLFR